MCVGSTWFKVQGAEQQQSCLETFKAETRSTCWTLPGAQSSRPTACIIHQYTLDDAPFRTLHLSRLPAHNYNYVTTVTVASLVQDTNGFFRLGSGFFYARKRSTSHMKKGAPTGGPRSQVPFGEMEPSLRFSSLTTRCIDNASRYKST